jgi:hypothetical protein
MCADIEGLEVEWMVFDASPIVGYYSVKLLDQMAGTVDDLDNELQSSGSRHFLLQEDLRRFGLNSCEEVCMDLW